MRWLMVDQAWQPMLWLGVGWFFVALMPRLHLAFPLLSGLMAACAVVLSLGHNTMQTRAALTEVALHNGVVALAARWGDRLPLHIIVLVKDEVRLASRDVMNLRIAKVWFRDRPVTLRTLQRGAEPAEPSHNAWWKVVFGEHEVSNVAIGSGVASYDEVAFASFDGQRVLSLDRITEADVAGYPVEWRRAGPVMTLDSPPSTSC